jgi:hypothetical protein
MRIYTVVTPSHQVLYERFFLPSVAGNGFELVPYLLEQEGTGDFLAQDFKTCIAFKLQKILESIRDNPNEIVVWSDVDIQFFKLEPRHITSYFAPETDFVAQRLTFARREICGGFYAIRCSRKMEDFYEEVATITCSETDGNEQDAINLLLQRSPGRIHWCLFGREIYSRTHGFQIPPTALLHHATCFVLGNSVNQKFSLLTQLERFDRWSPLRKRLYWMIQAPAALKRRLTTSR